jgi:Asp-tRNA(Asn)/Glu-tRNA(Gln) amidotransferase A subunit family amidase
LSKEGLLIGLQLVGKHWSENTLLKLGDAYERVYSIDVYPKVFAD